MPRLPGLAEQKFYLRHPDDAGFHIMVDDDFNITGLIDWEWGRTMPRAVAFSTPSWLWDVGDFFDGSNKLSDREMTFARMLEDRPSNEMLISLGKCAREGRGLQRFFFLLGYEFYDGDFGAYKTMFGALRKILDVDEDLSWEDWRVTALDRYAHDRQLKKLLAK